MKTLHTVLTEVKKPAGIAKLAIPMLIGCGLAMLMVLNSDAAIIAGIVICAIPAAIVAGKRINAWLLDNEYYSEKKFIGIIIFIYPLLPLLWGIEVGSTLPVIRAHRLLMMIVILYLALNGIFLKSYADFFKSGTFTLPVACIIFSMFITMLGSFNFFTSMFFLFSFVFESLILAVVVFTVFRERHDIDILISILCMSGYVLALLGIFEAITEINVFSYFGVYRNLSSLTHQIREGEIRIYGSFDHAISFGTYFALLLPLYFYKFEKHPLKLYASIGLILGVIVATQSRAAQIGAGITILMYFLFINRKQILLMMILLIPAILANFGTLSYHMRTLNPFAPPNEVLQASTMARTAQFDFLLHYIKKQLLIGYGMVDVPLMMRWIGNYANTIDNYYLLYTFYYGLIGLATWLILMIAVLVKPILYFGKAILDNHLMIMLLTACIVFCVINYVVALWSFHFLFWIYVGIIARLLVNYKNEVMQHRAHMTMSL